MMAGLQGLRHAQSHQVGSDTVQDRRHSGPFGPNQPPLIQFGSADALRTNMLNMSGETRIHSPEISKNKNTHT